MAITTLHNSENYRCMTLTAPFFVSFFETRFRLDTCAQSYNLGERKTTCLIPRYFCGFLGAPPAGYSQASESVCSRVSPSFRPGGRGMANSLRMGRLLSQEETPEVLVLVSSKSSKEVMHGGNICRSKELRQEIS
eukprot:285136-Pelagomonas_calceolata.AAC.1